MRKMRQMLLSGCLKADLRKNNRARLFFLFFLCFAGWRIFPIGPSERSGYTINSDRQLLVSIIPDSLNEFRLKSNILNGGKSEIGLRFRIKIDQNSKDVALPQVNEVRIRKTGYRDIITGDYILQINGREAGTYREWPIFYKHFSEIDALPMGIAILSGESPEIRCRMEIVYKKFVAPLNLLYLIPGKYITRGRWETIRPESHRG
jgi:hypothetical protein